MVNKKRRRKQLARAYAERRAVRRAQRAARRRRMRLLAGFVLAGLAAAAFVLWVVLHDSGSAAAFSMGVY